jgi:hypothetical protein
MFEQVQQRQRRLAFAQVVAGVLAHLLGAGRVVEHVVDQLERGADAAAVLGGGFFHFRVRAGQHRAELGRCLEQLGGLVADDLQVALHRDVGSCMFSNCSTSPSAITLVALERISMMRMLPASTIIWKARE